MNQDFIDYWNHRGLGGFVQGLVDRAPSEKLTAVTGFESAIEEIASQIKSSRDLDATARLLAETRGRVATFCQDEGREAGRSLMLELYRGTFDDLDNKLSQARAKKADDEERMRKLFSDKFAQHPVLSAWNTQVDSAFTIYHQHTQGETSKDEFEIALDNLKRVQAELTEAPYKASSSTESRMDAMLRKNFGQKVSSALETMQTYWDGLPEEADKSEAIENCDTVRVGGSGSASNLSAGTKSYRDTEAYQVLSSLKTALAKAVTTLKDGTENGEVNDGALREFTKLFNIAYEQAKDVSARLGGGDSNSGAIEGPEVTMRSIRSFLVLVDQIDSKRQELARLGDAKASDVASETGAGSA